MALIATAAMLPSAHLLATIPHVVTPGDCKNCLTKLTYFFANFAISALAGWTGYYMLILLAMTLAYESPIEATSEEATTACLSIFLLSFLLILLLHLWPLERINRHHIGIQVIMIIAALSLYVNLKEETTNGRLSLSILILTSVGLLVKGILGVIRDKMEGNTSSETFPVLA